VTALIELAQEGRQYPGFLVVQPVADGALNRGPIDGPHALQERSAGGLDSDDLTPAVSEAGLAAHKAPCLQSVRSTYNSKKRLQMITNQIRLQIAEKSAGSLNFLALLRWALVIIFLWFGGMKFTAYEAAGIAPFIEHSPIMSWLHALFGVQGASYVIGVIELSTAAALILGAFQPIFSALGAAMSAATYLITLTFFLSTPGVAEATAGGFPAISAAPGQFLLKDLVLLAASLSLLFASVQGPWLNVQKS
jgi:reactive chlorine resistance protein C